MSQPRPKLGIFFPMYNEEDNLRPSVDRATEVLSELAGDDYEILIVNDASRDRTGEIADAVAAADPHVRVVHHPTNQSLGGAIQTGLATSRAEVTVYVDGDLPCDLGNLREALPLLDDADLVIGYRVGRRESFLRKVYSFVYNRLIRLLFGVRVRDVNFSFKLFKRHVVDSLQVHSKSGFIDAEILAECIRQGYRIGQLPVVNTPRVAGVSTLAHPARILEILQDLRAYRRRRRQRSAR